MHSEENNSSDSMTLIITFFIIMVLVMVTVKSCGKTSQTDAEVIPYDPSTTHEPTKTYEL